MARNGSTYTTAMVNAKLASHAHANEVTVVIVEENEDDYDPTNELADLTRVGTQEIHIASLSCVLREVDCGGPYHFDPVVDGLPAAYVVLSDRVAGTPKIIAVVNCTDGTPYDMNLKGPLYMLNLILKWGFYAEE